MDKKYVFPKKCCVCMTDCNTQRELTLNQSTKQGFATKITTTRLSVPVCNKCRGKFNKINYGWCIWLALVAIGALIGIPVGLASPAGKIIPGMGLGALALGVLGIIPSIMIAIKYGHKTDPPAFLSHTNGRPVFLNKDYQHLFDTLNPLE